MRVTRSWAVGWVLVLGSGPGEAAGRPAPIPAATAIVAVESAVRPDAVTVTIRGNGALSPGRIRRVEHFRPRLVIDFPGLAAEAAPAVPVGNDPVDRVRVDRHSVELTRVVVELARSARYRVELAGLPAQGLRVVFPREAPVEPGPGGAGAPPLRGPARLAGRFVGAVGELGAGATPFLRPARPGRVVAAASAIPATAVYAGRGSDVPGGAGVPVGATPESGGHRPSRGATRRAGDMAASGSLRRAGASWTSTGPSLRGDMAAPGSLRRPGQATRDRPPYTGDPVSMDFQNADLRAVLRVFAEISDLNLVIDPSVQGVVNVALTQVPWDQAFDVILRANGLDYEIEGTVVRIASVERLRQEAEARAALAQREAEAGELAVFTRTLSYARADDLVPLLTSTLLSPRGEVFTDPRTNTLIIRDLEDRRPALDDLLATLDRVEPQVEIEARIVRAGHDSARALGVQWGFGGRPASDGGGSPGPPGTGATGSGLALSDRRLETGVDLGVGAPTSSLGVALGSAGAPLDLDVVLSALESRGELQIISSPRVTTQNNVEAEILQGDQIPYQTVANNTVTVQFKEAALTLRVTPQITAADTVIMQVEVENSFADFARALGTPPIPAIVTQRASTTVQVGDGETAVIGGIYENTRSRQSSRTPGLHRVPLLGWLFKSSARNESTDQLMMFLTPRIVRR